MAIFNSSVKISNKLVLRKRIFIPCATSLDSLDSGQALDLAGNTGEEDPCEEARLAISVGVPWFKLTFKLPRRDEE